MVMVVMAVVVGGDGGDAGHDFPILDCFKYLLLIAMLFIIGIFEMGKR